MEPKKSNILTENVAWAIKTIKIDKSLNLGIKDIDLAMILGTNKDTLATYRNKKGLLKGIVIERLVSVYNFNPMWLLKDIGEPFPGARIDYPDICGPEEVPQETFDKKSSIYNKEGAIGVGEPVSKYNEGVNLKDKLIRSQEKLITHLEKENSDLKARLEVIEKEGVK